ncbi:hypothetical protein [Vibrio sp. 10N.261.55.A7]|nr:hypothetical protein [Vibrio sp. 10N.261.55.A7]
MTDTRLQAWSTKLQWQNAERETAFDGLGKTKGIVKMPFSIQLTLF